jgi:cobyrinic acid a,c-diamide synthase
MAGVFPAETVMRKSGLTLGYRIVEVTRPCLLGRPGTSLRGHEFHYSTLEPTGELHYACTLSDAEGRAVGHDGLTTRNTIALYSHLHFGSRPEMVADLLTAARRESGHRRSVRKG